MAFLAAIVKRACGLGRACGMLCMRREIMREAASERRRTRRRAMPCNETSRVFNQMSNR